MKSFLALFVCTFINLTLSPSDDTSKTTDLQIATTVRQAVREADEELLKSTLLGSWREYLKLAAMDLDIQLQPLVLIKFDEDISFRNQIKKLIEWQAEWDQKETEHYIYYYRWDHPLPELILGVQDAHFQELSRIFGLDLKEKIPYRYDLEVDESVVFPFDDLRGGITSPYPFDLGLATRAMLSSFAPNLTCFTEPMARIYGDYFQNPSTAEAYYDTCVETARTQGFTPMLQLFQDAEGRPDTEYCSFAFVYQLDRQFGPRKIIQFLKTTTSESSKEEFSAAFEQTFSVSLSEFESKSDFYQAASKL